MQGDWQQQCERSSSTSMRGLVAPMRKELNTHTHKNNEPTQEVSNTTQEEQ